MCVYIKFLDIELFSYSIAEPDLAYIDIATMKIMSIVLKVFMY